VSAVLTRAGANGDEIHAFRLAVSELASNAVMHGTNMGWTVGVKVTRQRYTLNVSGGDADEANVIFHPDRWTVADASRPTGRGLGIVRELMDEVFVERWRGRVRVVCRP
jgi:anti-sigma regulatory factor (Ser/Thr protein kinase)